VLANFVIGCRVIVGPSLLAHLLSGYFLNFIQVEKILHRRRALNLLRFGQGLSLR
jgi:hypothetical protein